MTLFDTKMMHFESMRTVVIHLDKFKDQNDKSHEYEDQHDTLTQV
jgi:Fe-S-cluster formation regulator IscX/YfhJ